MAPPMSQTGRHGQRGSTILPISGTDYVTVNICFAGYTDILNGFLTKSVDISADDCFSSRREPALSASTSWLPTGSSSLMLHGIRPMTYRAFTGFTASVS